ncbi:PREDICTED: uncharacterized protein LOC101312114 isoform X2 [Fragaria vesca subsp. vesca]|uniref:uncharacterized protein LOC101312114 isoform X2 n=1 Tax=Fragaria vesca subsp. vesca TaxID=101020 RepID=UPI0002C33113|nr:PREDICTED: uncharacterized protein LOC101312114 isoform X2 [Fragaria vesca subsp. vesca]
MTLRGANHVRRQQMTVRGAHCVEGTRECGFILCMTPVKIGLIGSVVKQIADHLIAGVTSGWMRCSRERRVTHRKKMLLIIQSANEDARYAIRKWIPMYPTLRRILAELIGSAPGSLVTGYTDTPFSGRVSAQRPFSIWADFCFHHDFSFRSRNCVVGCVSDHR